MDLDRQSIERRDFPIARRGYDPASVDAHLRALADEVAELQRLVLIGAERQQPSTQVPAPAPTLSSAAGEQVRSILEAAEVAAADIEREAQESARRVTEEAGSAARKTREDAITRAESQVAAVSAGAERLLGDVEIVDGEIGVLVNGVREAAGRLVGELGSVQADMAALYDAATGRAVAEGGPTADLDPAPSNAERFVQAPLPTQSPAQSPQVHEAQELAIGEVSAVVSDSTDAEGPAEASGGVDDLDGARLAVLNMALNGEPREEADRYLAEHFQIEDRQRLLTEVYAAIEE